MNSSTRYEAYARELVRAVRGKRSQESLSRKLGFKSNIVHKWESGDAATSWPQFVELCRASRIELEKPFRYILGFAGDPKASGALVSHLCGTDRISDLTQKTGESRFTLSRWISGRRAPRLEVILRLLDEQQFILLEFVTALVPIENVPLLHTDKQELKVMKDAIYGNPFIEGILAAVALEAYRTLARHRRGFIAGLLGIPLAEELQGLEILERVGFIEKAEGKFRIRAGSIDTQGNFFQGKEVRKYWAGRYQDFLRVALPPGTNPKSKTGYFVFDISSEGEAEILKAYHEFCFRVRNVASRDRGAKATAKLCAIQVIDLVELGASAKRES